MATESNRAETERRRRRTPKAEDDAGAENGEDNSADENGAEAKPKPAKRKAAKADSRRCAGREGDAAQPPTPAPRRNRNPKAGAKRRRADSESGQMDLAGPEGDPIAVGDADE